MTIYKLLNQFQFKLTSSVSISNSHLSMYKMMAMLVYLCSILVSTTTMFGDPINCMVQAPVPEKMFSSYCYMESSYSYSLPTNSSHYDFSKLTTKPNYYQWVWLLLTLQALLTFLPCMAWEYLEGGKLARLLINPNPVLIGEFLGSQHRRWYSSQAISFLVCQLACPIVSMVQVYLMDQFLGGGVVTTSMDTWAPPVMFPKLVKCNMPYTGFGGSVENYSGMCTLNYNLLHEKIYMMIIPCYLLLALFSITHSLLHLLILLIPRLRLQLLKLKAVDLLSNKLLGMKVSFCSYGDFILFMLLSSNMGAEDFSKMMTVWVDKVSAIKEQDKERNHQVSVKTFNIVAESDQQLVYCELTSK